MEITTEKKPTRTKHVLFDVNDRGGEEWLICSRDTYFDWKEGKLIYFPEENCFASLEITEERFKGILQFYDHIDPNGNVTPNEEWRNQWTNMTPEERSEWYKNYINTHYIFYTYEEFCNSVFYETFLVNVVIEIGENDTYAIAFGQRKDIEIEQ